MLVKTLHGAFIGQSWLLWLLIQLCNNKHKNPVPTIKAEPTTKTSANSPVFAHIPRAPSTKPLYIILYHCDKICNMQRNSEDHSNTNLVKWRHGGVAEDENERDPRCYSSRTPQGMLLSRTEA